MRVKKCFKCHQELSLDSFYKHPKMSDGHLGKCKNCTKTDVRNNRKNNLEYYRQYDLQRWASNKARRKAVAKTSKLWRQKDPKRYKAHYAVSNAVRDGRLIKPKHCEDCGKKMRLHGHHEDYTKPLDVIWLCPPCHFARHH